MNRKIFAWALYDFADLLLIANFTLYFSQWVIIDNHFEDIWYGGAIALATVLLVLTAPFWGAYSDQTGKKVGILYPLTGILILATFLLGIVGAGNFLPTGPKVLVALGIFVVVQYCYQLGLIFVDALIPILAKPRSYGWVSGFGEGIGNLGYLVGLFLTYPFISGTVTLLGSPGRIQAFIPTAFFDLVLSLPMFFLIRDAVKRSKAVAFSVGQVYGRLREILKDRNLLLYLISFYFLADAILTMTTFYPIYFQQVLGMPDSLKIIALTVALLSLVIGALVCGKSADRYGSKRVYFVCVLMSMLTLAVYPLLAGTMFWLSLLVLGFFIGGFFSISRVILIQLAPAEKIGEFFSLFTIFRRFASIVGPILWGISILVFSSFGINKYRIAVYPLVVMMIIGLWLLRKVEIKNTPGNSHG